MTAIHTVANLDLNRFDARMCCGRGGVLDDEARRRIPVRFLSTLSHPVAPLHDAASLVEIASVIAAERRRCAATLIVHTHCSKAGVLGRLVARAAGATVVVHTFHGLGFHANRAVRAGFLAMERSLRGRADALLFVSKLDMDYAERVGLLVGSRGYLVRSGINVGAFKRDPGARRVTRAELNIQDDARVVVTVANFKPVKNLLLGLRAFARVAAWDPKAIWIIAGGGERRTFEAELERRRLGQRVRVLGWRRDVAKLLSASDVYMLSSDYEGLPCSVLESIAAHLPVVATAAGGVVEVVDERTGVVVPVGNADALAAGLWRMLNDPPDLKRTAREVLTEFDIDETVRRQETIYEELSARKATETKNLRKRTGVPAPARSFQQ